MLERELNYEALEVVDEAIEFAPELKIDVHEYDNGATLLDYGVNTTGGIEAGVYYAEISGAGLVSVSVETDHIDSDTPINAVDSWTDHPELALLGAQWSSWKVESEGYEGVVCGPGKMLTDHPPNLPAPEEDFAVLCLEPLDGSGIPPESLVEELADECGVSPGTTYVLVAPVSSIAGVVQTASRAPETAVLRLRNLGYDISLVETASGTAPVAPVTGNHKTMSNANDAIRYAGDVYLRVQEYDDAFEDLPTSATENHGIAFEELYGSNLHETDESVFTPASVTIDFIGGRTETYGERDDEFVSRNFF